jgi:2-iminobutanoate/2-iminopropanoate deaminase
MSAAGAPRYLTSPATTAAKLPFSEAVRVGELLFLSGQIGNRPGTLELVPGGIAAEARQTMENVRTTLERHGASLADVVKCTVFLADMAEWREFNAVYLEYFAPDRLPARSALGASGLALGGRVELECVAWSPAPAGAAAGDGEASASGARTPRQPYA